MNDKLIVPLDISERDVSRRTQAETERDRVMIARMYVRGKSQHEMLLKLNELYPPDKQLDRIAIHKDLDEIRKSWLQSTLVDFNAAKVKELARIDEVEREAWEAWERSKSKHVRIEMDEADDQVAFSVEKVAPIHRTHRRKVIDASAGEIKYLEMIERMIKMRCDIIGLFQAQKLQIDWKAEALQSGLDEQTVDAVKENVTQLLLQAITQAAKDSGAIKEEDIIDTDFKVEVKNDTK